VLSEENPKAFGIARDVIEEERRYDSGALAVDQLGYRSDLEIPVGAMNSFELSYGLHDFEPVPQVRVGPRHVLFSQLCSL